MNQKSLIVVLGVVVIILIGTTMYFSLINKSSQPVAPAPKAGQQTTQTSASATQQQAQQAINESKEINKDPSTSNIKTSYDILAQAGKANDNKTVEKYILDKDLQMLISDDKKFTELMKFLSNLTDPTDLMTKNNFEGIDNITMVTHLLIDGKVGATCGLPFVQENGIWKLHHSFIFCN